MRNPRRTAATANALLIGVGIVSLITVLYGSLRTSIDNQISEAFTGDVTITSGGFGRGGVSPTLAQSLNQLPEVAAAAPLDFGLDVRRRQRHHCHRHRPRRRFEGRRHRRCARAISSRSAPDGVAVHDSRTNGSVH